MRTIYLLVLISLAALTCMVQGADDEATEMFQQANGLFAQGQLLMAEERQTEAVITFRQATRAYEELLVSGFVNGSVLYNLGNAYYRQGRIGKAIVNYQRAQRLAPRNPTIKANLKQAKQQIKDRELSSNLPSFFRSLLFFYYSLNLNEATVLALCLYFAFCLLEVLYIFTKSPYAKYATVTLVALTILVTISLCLKFRNEQCRRSGVVIAHKCPVRVGPGKEHPALFTAHEGADVIVEEEQAGSNQEKRWLRVRVLIEAEERTEKEMRRVYGPEGYVQSTDVELL